MQVFHCSLVVLDDQYMPPFGLIPTTLIQINSQLHFIFSVYIVASVMPKPSNYLVKPKDMVTLQNKDVILECIVTGYPKPHVEWHKNGNRITLTPSGRYSKYGASSLKVSSVQAADGGKYECVMGADKATANLEVIGENT